LQAELSCYQALVIGQRKRAMAVLRQRQRHQEFGEPLHSALSLELGYVLDEITHMLRDRRDHRHCNIGIVTNTADNVIRGDPRDPRCAYRFRGRKISVAGKRDRLCKAAALRHRLNYSLVAT
jgi:hypothetical protein